MRIKIVAPSRDRPILRGQLRAEVEAVPVVIPGFEFIKTLYATPAITDGDPTEQFVISDSVTGATISNDLRADTIDEAVSKAAAHLNLKKITPWKWKAAVDRTLANNRAKGLTDDAVPG